MTTALQPSSYALAGWLFRRLLAIVYLLAFVSIAVQLPGLVGSGGILPARDYLAAVGEWTPSPLERTLLFPTLCWISTSDPWLMTLAMGGAVLAALLLAGFVPALALPLLWVGYLSLTVVGRDFFAYQWDALLLETGFLAIFLAPARLRDRLADAAEPARLARGLLVWLLFRLMMGSGVIKLTSGDPTWRGLTAMAFHYETQPLPTPAAWYAHQLPLWVHRTTTAGVIVLELVAPLLMLGRRRLRHLACGLMLGLLGLIALTGNYAFFGLLSASLCVLLLDDAALGRVMPARWSGGRTGRDARAFRHTGAARWMHQAALAGVAIVTVPVSAYTFARVLGAEPAGGPLAQLTERLAPFRIVNGYGLFAVMTTTRPEIGIEGSEDGAEWKAYEFRYKPGDLRRRPPWVAPHQPRLDWQMWFAALGEYDREPWVSVFLERLLEGSPDVLRLMGHDPFAGRRPRYVRAVLYEYRFASAAERRDGRWWTRVERGPYSPRLSRPD